MILMFEFSPPLRIKPKLEKLGKKTRFGTRVIWLWFSVAYFPRLGINEVARAYRNAGKEELISGGWRAP